MLSWIEILFFFVVSTIGLYLLRMIDDIGRDWDGPETHDYDAKKEGTVTEGILGREGN